MPRNKINILWVVNNPFPEYCNYYNIKSPVVGGWMYDLSIRLSKIKEINLAIAFPFGNKFSKLLIDERLFYSVPYVNKNKFEKLSSKTWSKIVREFKPNLVHFHGTEYAHGISLLEHIKDTKKIVSIQGLISVYNKYYFGGITFSEIICNLSIRDLIFNQSLFIDKYKFSKKSKNEIKLIRNADIILGRTEWDKSHSFNISNDRVYMTNNESLRLSFYKAKKWNISSCNKYSIFLSQAHYPIKGAHKLIDAVKILKKEYPKIKIKIAGHSNPINKSFLKRKTYDNYIRKKIIKYDLIDNIEFLGLLSEEDMILNYQQAHIFICPSAIENSPNSVAEAQLIGTPVIASLCGGIQDMIVHNNSGILYRFEEVELLAFHIKRIFDNDVLSKKLSLNGIEFATKRHDSENNLKELFEIYKTL